MLILTIANLSAMDLTRRLEAANVPATVLHSLGTCAPWPIEAGATALIIGTPRGRVEHVTRLICRDLGESAAFLIEIPATFDFISPEG